MPDLTLRLFIAISKFDYKNIEQLVKTGRNLNLLSVTDERGNTFVHLVARLMRSFWIEPKYIPDSTDDPSPLLLKTVNIKHRNKKYFHYFEKKKPTL